MNQPFVFLDPGELVDAELTLVAAELIQRNAVKRQEPAYRFDMRHSVSGAVMGRIALRVSSLDYFRLYAGHIGYFVEEQHRGHRYSARSIKLLEPLARRHGFRELWITTDPANAASRRTCELAGAVYVDTVNVPDWTDLYRRGDRQKCRYLLRLAA